MRNLVMTLFVCLVMACGREASHFDEARIHYTLINGNVVTTAYPQIVYLSTGSGRCTATLVGPRALITAAHCGATGSVASFSTNEKNYYGVVAQSPLYATRDHDIAMIHLAQEMDRMVPPYSVGGIASVGKTVYVFGYGCTSPGGGGGNDGYLRTAASKIVAFQKLDLVTQLRGGAVLCFGDSGGPVFDVAVPKKPRLLAINSKGDIRTTSFQTRLDLAESQNFIKAWAASTRAEVCGVTKVCD